MTLQNTVIRYGFLALLHADRWNRRGERRDLWISALCIGFAANAKLHAAVLRARSREARAVSPGSK